MKIGRRAGKRWVKQYGPFYAKQGVTILGDDLFSRQPFIQALKDEHLHFILVNSLCAVTRRRSKSTGVN